VVARVPKVVEVNADEPGLLGSPSPGAGEVGPPQWPVLGADK
jgi:hypothetical protein